MKFSFLPGLLLAALIMVSAPEALAKKKKHKPKSAPAAPGQPDYSEPTEALAPYIIHLEQLLSLQRTAPKEMLPILDEAPGKIAIARLEFAAQRKTAAPEDQAEFDAGIATCDALIRALDERRNTLGDIHESSAVKSSTTLGSGPRKDNLTQGIHGGDFAKGVGAGIEYKREKDAKGAAKKGAAQTDAAFSATRINRWNKRAAELRTVILAAYAKTK